MSPTTVRVGKPVRSDNNDGPAADAPDARDNSSGPAADTPDGHNKVRRAALVVPLVLVNLVAVYGQYQWADDHLPGLRIFGINVIAVLFAAAVETVALFLTVEADAALRAGDGAARLRWGSYFMGGLAGALNYAHWDSVPEATTTTAVTFGILSALSPVLWGIRSRGVARTALRDKGLIDPRTVRFPMSQWVMYPWRSMGAYRLAVWTRQTDPDRARAEFDVYRAAKKREAKTGEATEIEAIPDDEHLERLTALANKAQQIRYAADQLATTNSRAVREFLARYGITTTRQRVNEALRTQSRHGRNVVPVVRQEAS